MVSARKMDGEDRSHFFGGKNDPEGEAYDAGFGAYHDSKPLTPNPYQDRGDRLATAYADGWNDALHQENKELRELRERGAASD